MEDMGAFNVAGLIVSGDASITNSKFTSCEVGIEINSVTPTINNVSIQDSNDFGIRVTDGSPTIANSCLTNNPTGIENTGAGTVNAVDNWWGDVSGPFHPTTNPTGLGNQVSDGVLFNPWLLTDPCTQAVAALNIVSLSPQANTNNVALNSSIAITFDQDIDGATANSTNIVIRGEQTGILNGVFSGGGTPTISFNPDNDFKAGEVIRITLTTGILSTSGGALSASQSFQFNAAAAPAPEMPPFFEERIVNTSTEAGKPVYVFSADIDGDGDMDLLVADDIDDEVSWYENDGNQNFTEYIILSPADFVTSVFATDVDDDGDMDVLASYNNNIVWFENDGSENFTEKSISAGAFGSSEVFAVDMDGDGDMDVISVAFLFSQIAWYENDGSENFTAHIITHTITFALSIYAADIDLDGYMDLLSASQGTQIAWLENDGAQNFTERIVSTGLQSFHVYATDLDSDGDMDILSGGSITLTWHENDGAQSFTEHSIIGTINIARDIYATDIDGDADMDVIAVGSDMGGGEAGLYVLENDGSENFTQRETLIGVGVSNPQNLYVADIDGDNDLDVLACNQFGDKVTWFENTISGAAAITITTQPQDQTICEGENASFSVAATGDTGLTYQWQVDDGSGFVDVVNGSVYSNATTTTLDITGASSAMDGYQFHCVVSGDNAPDATSSEAVLTVNTGISITTQPASQTACEGADVNFIISATGSGPIAYQWQKDGADLPGETSTTLTLNAIIVDDGGDYACVISNSCGSTTSLSAALTIENTPLISVQPSSSDAQEGEDISFEVTATGTAPLTYQWKKDDIDITGATESNYTIDPVDVTDEGNYSCVVSNGCDAVISDVAALTVSVEETNGQQSTGLMVFEGEDNQGAMITNNQSQAIDLGTTSYAQNRQKTFAIENTGNTALEITSISIDNQAFVLISAPSSIAVGATETFVIELIADVVGALNATVEVNSSAGVFTFPITGEITAAPVIILYDGADNIAPQIINNQSNSVDFGTTDVSQGIARTFTLENIGTAVLGLNSISSDEPAFIISDEPSTIEAGEVETFTITLQSDLAGVFSGIVTINSNAEDFTFPVRGEIIQEIMILSQKPPLIIYNAVSPNGDGKHDFFKIENIEEYPGNRLQIYNRWGDKVFDLENYDNVNNNFRGQANVGGGGNLSDGTYFYVLDSNDGGKLDGFLILRR